jgi:hypothetical protein
MNQIHIVGEFLPFGELNDCPYVKPQPGRRLHGIATEVTVMTFIFSFYAAILALAVWQENQGIDKIGCANKES